MAFDASERRKYDRIMLVLGVLGLLGTVIFGFCEVLSNLYPTEFKKFIQSLRGGGTVQGDTGQYAADSISVDSLISLIPHLDGGDLVAYRQVAFGTGLPSALDQRLRRLIDESHPIVTVAFRGGEHGEWVIVYDTNSYAASPNLPPRLVGALDSLREHGARVRQILFTQWAGGWAILHGKNGFVSEGEPRGLRQAFHTLVDQGDSVRSLAFSNVGGWVLSIDGRSSLINGPFLSNEIAHTLHRAAALDLVSLTPQGGYLLMEEGRDPQFRGLPDGATRALAELVKKRGRVSLASFDTAGAWLILASEPEAVSSLVNF